MSSPGFSSLDRWANGGARRKRHPSIDCFDCHWQSLQKRGSKSQYDVCKQQLQQPVTTNLTMDENLSTLAVQLSSEFLGWAEHDLPCCSGGPPSSVEPAPAPERTGSVVVTVPVVFAWLLWDLDHQASWKRGWQRDSKDPLIPAKNFSQQSEAQ